MNKKDAIALIDEAAKSYYRANHTEQLLIARVLDSDTILPTDARRLQEYYRRAVGGGYKVYHFQTTVPEIEED